MKKLVTLLVFGIIIGSMLLSVSKAEAYTICNPANLASTCKGYFGATIAQNHFWCNVLGAPVNPAQPCNISGNQKFALPNMTPASTSAQLKAEFINDINAAIAAGGYQRTGASFLIDLMLGANHGKLIAVGDSFYNDWLSRVNDAGLTLAVQSKCYAVNTAYDPVTNDEVFYSLSGCTNVLAFYSGATVYDEVKLDCGNPLGAPKALPIPMPPPPPVSWNLVGTTTVSKTNIYPGQTATFNDSLKNTAGSPATTNWIVRYCYDSCPGGYTSGYLQLAGHNGTVSGLSSGKTSALDTFNYTPAANTANTGFCLWVVFTDASGPGTAGGRSTMQCVSISQPTPVCNISAMPSTVTAGQGFTVTISVAYQDSAAALAVWNNGGRSFYMANGTTQTGGSLSPGTNVISWTTAVPPQPVGTTNVVGGVKGSAIPAGNVSCSTTVITAYAPYFNVLGGDIIAGLPTKSGTTCPAAANPSTDIIMGQSNVGTWFGSGSQDAAFALDQIKYFSSGLDPAASLASPKAYTLPVPSALSFANTNLPSGITTAAPNNGGGFGDYGYCASDYYSDAAGRPSVSNLGNPGAFSIAGQNGTKLVTGNLTLNAAALAAGQRLSVVVLGNVYITGGDITAPAVINPTDAPYFELIVKGNIYVDGNTNTLYGFYSAQSNNGVGGLFASCSQANGTETTQYAVCSNKPLIIQGSLSAEQTHFDRSYGTVSGSGAGPTSASPAESVQFTPMLWIGASYACVTDPSFCTPALAPDYYSATGLSPIL